MSVNSAAVAHGADYVIEGAGSAGCVLASRLSEDPSCQVVLIEAGSRSWHPWLHIPIGYFKTMGDPRFDWKFLTEPEPGMAGRRIPFPRGCGIGGSSLINGMLYLRGQQHDKRSLLKPSLHRPASGQHTQFPLCVLVQLNRLGNPHRSSLLGDWSTRRIISSTTSRALH